MREEIIDSIKQNRVIAIVRGVRRTDVVPLAEALYAGGIRLMEITYAHGKKGGYDETDASIRDLSSAFSGRMYIGAGTVISEETLDRAINAGARFIVSPDTNPGLIKKTRACGLVSVPGAMTPTEILTAYNAGADFVKVFPAGDLGEGYFKSVRAPLSHVPLLAVGGITPENIKRFLDAGAMGAGISSYLVNKPAIARGDFDFIAKSAERLTRALES